MATVLTVLASISVGAITMIVLHALNVPAVLAGILGAFAFFAVLMASPR